MNRSRGVAVASMACGLFWTSLTTAQEISPTQDAERHFDARLDLNRGFVASRSAVAIQPQAIQGLYQINAQVPQLSAVSSV